MSEIDVVTIAADGNHATSDEIPLSCSSQEVVGCSASRELSTSKRMVNAGKLQNWPQVMGSTSEAVVCCSPIEKHGDDSEPYASGRTNVSKP
ncbi:hypothetical protein HID58_066007 [Brassica napus]|uniref:(rape) hypothetical protein n=1 Tax=Brassica napus TaxID=3708 RepID=A0A816KYK7_BRANA|nr:hypothetical protein HID58_066007 [Brassica napus]CAF1928339.1 unnamed protein product [Brassica napus]